MTACTADLERFVKILSFAITLLLVSGSVLADTIAAKLTVSSPTVFIGLPGSFVQVPATSVTFSAGGDTSAVYSYVQSPPPSSYVLDSPIAIDIPGVVSFVSNEQGSSISTSSSASFPGVFLFSLRSIPGPGSQSVYMVEPIIGGYNFRSSLQPLAVTAISSVNLPVGGLMTFSLADGRVVGIQLPSLPGILQVDVTASQPIPASSTVSFVLLVIGVGALAARSLAKGDSIRGSVG